MKRTTQSSGSPWESIVGYARAVRVGPFVYVAGTTALDREGNVVCHGDAYGQTIRILEIIEQALNGSGASLRDVVRTRIYVTDITEWEEVGRAHGTFFGEIRPAATMVEVSRLIDPVMLVEIEVDAVVSEESVTSRPAAR